jgi:hypothetical protein
MTGQNMTNPKHEIRNPKQYQSTNDQNLEQNFAKGKEGGAEIK